MHENFQNDCGAKNDDCVKKISLKRSNARVCNLDPRMRTKSEDSILCGNRDSFSLAMDSISKMDQMLIEFGLHKSLKTKSNKRQYTHNSSVGGEQDMVVTAIYNYLPSHDDELALYPGDKVMVLSNDYRDSGTEGWWVGLRDSQIGVFPLSYVETESRWSIISGAGDGDDKDIRPEVTPRTANDNCCKISPSSAERKDSSGFNVLSGSTGVKMISSSDIIKLECLGSGSFGVVYHGRWNNKEVAVKTFSVFANEIQIYQEAGHLSCLLHPNIVRLFGVSIINDMGNQIALIMEYARGGALHNFLHFGPKIKLSPHTLLQMSKQIALGMKYLHKEAGICHRDLKSSNVLIKEAISDSTTDAQIASCTLLITDFGMARRTVDLVSQQSKLGTLAYAAPEVCRQQGGFTIKSDIWSYGILLWELLTIDIPYRDIEQPHLLYKIAIKNQTLHIPTGIPSLLVNLLISCWNEERDLRPDFDEVSQVLNRAQKCKFMEISAEEFYVTQNAWREEIRLSEKNNDESMAPTDTECNEFLEQQREIAQAREELQKREEDMQRREAACSQAIGTVNQFTLLFSVLVANQTSRNVYQSTNDNVVLSTKLPPVPPPRKRPFVGRFKFWSHTNSYNNRNNTFQSSFSTLLNTDSPNISAPSNVQHVVHISQQDFNLASPALKFFPDLPKMHTWGPKSVGKCIFNSIIKQHSLDESNQRTSQSQLGLDLFSPESNSTRSVESSNNCLVTIKEKTHICSSVPNLMNVCQPNISTLDSSCFRHPSCEMMKGDTIDPPVISNCPSCYFKWLDNGKRISCDHHKRKSTREPTIIETPVLLLDIANSDIKSCSCILKSPTDSSHQKLGSNNFKKNNSCNSESKSDQKIKCKRGGQIDGAMWSIMRMLSAVALPDRCENAFSPLTDKYLSETQTSFSKTIAKSPKKRKCINSSMSRGVTIDENEVNSSGWKINSVFHKTLSMSPKSNIKNSLKSLTTKTVFFPKSEIVKGLKSFRKPSKDNYEDVSVSRRPSLPFDSKYSIKRNADYFSSWQSLNNS